MSRHVLQKVTLDREISAALDEALERTGYLPGSAKGRKWLAQLAVNAVCQEIISQGNLLAMPLAVTLRAETPEETDARLICLHMQEQDDLLQP